MNPPQGVLSWPSVESFFHRGALGGITVWYTGAVNQTAHTTGTFAAANLWARPIVLPGGVLDTIAMEVTTLGAGSAARVGIYKNTAGGILYPSSLVLDSGEFDTTSTGVKSASGLSVPVAPGLYWLAYLCRATAPGIRAVAIPGLGHMLGLPSTMGANLNQVAAVGLAYQALPASYPAGATLFNADAPLVAVHYAS